jgi:hypothetical protein
LAGALTALADDETAEATGADATEAVAVLAAAKTASGVAMAWGAIATGRAASASWRRGGTASFAAATPGEAGRCATEVGDAVVDGVGGSAWSATLDAEMGVADGDVAEDWDGAGDGAEVCPAAACACTGARGVWTPDSSTAGRSAPETWSISDPNARGGEGDDGVVDVDGAGSL